MENSGLTFTMHFFGQDLPTATLMFGMFTSLCGMQKVEEFLILEVFSNKVGLCDVNISTPGRLQRLRSANQGDVLYELGAMLDEQIGGGGGGQ